MTLILILIAVALAIVVANIAYRQATRFLLWISYAAFGFKHRELLVDGMRIVFLEKGSGRPLLLLHGIGADKSNFLLVGRSLARNFRVIIPDLPGFGDSDRPATASYSIDAQIRRLHDFVRALELDRFALGGHSMGGFIAGAYAVRYPENVSRLWLLAPAGVTSSRKSEFLQAIDDGNAPPIFARSLDEMRSLMHFTMSAPPYVPTFMLRAFAADQAERYEHHLRIMQELLSSEGLDERLQSASFDVPSLIVWGRDDRALHVSGADVLAQLLQQHRIQLLDAVGHCPQIEAPSAVSSEFEKFASSFLDSVNDKPH